MIEDKIPAIEDPLILNPILQNMVSGSAGTTGAMVVTDDGFVVAENISADIPAKTIAAITSSLLGLSESLSKQVKVGGCHNVIVEADNGLFIAKRINSTLILATMAKEGTQIGMLLSGTRACIETIQSKN